MEAKILDEAKKLVAAKADKVKVKGYLLFSGVSEKEANETLKSLGLVRKMSNFRDVLYARLEKGPIAEKDFKALVATGSANTKAHEKYFWGIAKLANDIWAAKK